MLQPHFPRFSLFPFLLFAIMIRPAAASVRRFDRHAHLLGRGRPDGLYAWRGALRGRQAHHVSEEKKASSTRACTGLLLV